MPWGFGIFEVRGRGAQEGLFKARTNLSLCEAEVHGWEIPTPCSVLSQMGKVDSEDDEDGLLSSRSLNTAPARLPARQGEGLVSL